MGVTLHLTRPLRQRLNVSPTFALLLQRLPVEDGL